MGRVCRCRIDCSPLVLAAFVVASQSASAQSTGETHAPPLPPPSASAAPEAADGWRIGGSLRLRYEALEGQFRPDEAAHNDALLSQLAVALEYRSGPWRFGGELIDSRVLHAADDGLLTTGEVNAAELTQLFLAADLGDTLGARSQTSLTFGRMTMDIGSRRFVARNNFRNTSNAFTGLRLERVGAAGDRLTAFYVLPHVRLPRERDALFDNRIAFDRESFDLEFWGVHYSRDWSAAGASVEAFVYRLAESDAPGFPTRNRQLTTVGGRISRSPSPGQLDYDLELALQRGSVRASLAENAERLPVSAGFLHGTLGYGLGGPLGARLAVQLDYASGDKPGSRSINRFDTLFGARRFEFGPTSLFGPLSRSNLIAGGVRLESRPSPRWTGVVGWRPSWLASRSDVFANTGVIDPDGRSGRFAGHLFEAQLVHWLIPERLEFDAGVGLLRRGRFLKRAPNANRFGDGRVVYAALTARF